MAEIDNNLIKSSSEGNMDAFGQIYKIISPYVYRVVYQITNNDQDTQDVTQDVFVKIYNKLKSFNYRSSFMTWVYRISVNTAKDAVEKRSRETNKKVDYDITMESVHTHCAKSRDLEKESVKARLRSILKMLNPDQRACIVLREIEGLSYQEIATTLNIKVNTVRSRLKRARQFILNLKKRDDFYEL